MDGLVGWLVVGEGGQRIKTRKCQGDKKRHLKILSLVTHTHTYAGNPSDKGEDVLL